MRRLAWLGLMALVAVGCGSTAGEDEASEIAAELAEAAPEVVEPGAEVVEAGEVAADGAPEAEVTPPATVLDEVDLRIGTMNWGGAFGATFPGATWPFGMIQPGPETAGKIGKPGILHTGGYFYGDDYLEGFSMCHVSGIGAPDYGHLLVTAVDGMDDTKTTEKGYRSRFSHDDEVLRPCYTRMLLLDTGIDAEATATARSALLRFTFPEGADPVVLFDLGHGSAGANQDASVRISDAQVHVDAGTGRLSGWLILHGALTGRVGGLLTYFVAEIDAPVVEAGVWDDASFRPGGDHAEGDESLPRVRIGAWARVTPDAQRQARVKVAISFRDEAAARANLDAEIPACAFADVRAACEAAWLDVLGRVEIEGGSATDRTVFWTAMVHSYLIPNLFTDADGRYRGFDGQIHDAGDAPFYSNFSMWDTYRTLHSLVTLLTPAIARDFAVSLVRMWEQGGFFPRWPAGLGEGGSMVGESAYIVLADTWVKGVTDWDADSAWAGMMHGATLPDETPGAAPRGGYQHYAQIGFVPADKEGGAGSKTLEFAYNDFAIAQLAQALGKADAATRFRERAAAAARAIWNPAVSFFDGTNADGSFVQPFDPFRWEEHWVEGNAWQYRFFLPWDADLLADLFGGVDELVAQLTVFFEESVPEVGLLVPGKYYWHGNEPDIHSAWLFADVGRPDLTQKWSRWILDTKYGPEPDDIDGNDDCGTLSAWAVFSMLGLYPVPARDDYLLGSPVFDKATLRLSGGDLVIVAQGASPANRYVQSVTWRGQPLAEARLRHADLVKGGELRFVMGPEPSAWGRK